MNTKFFPNHKISLKQIIIAFASIFAFLFAFRYDAFTHFNTHHFGGSERDAGLYIWLIKNNIQYLFSKNLFSPPVAWPYTDFLAWSDNFIFPSFIAIFLEKIGLTFPAICNSLLLGSAFLTGYLTYLLSHKISGEFYSSILSGIILISLSYFSEHLGHPQLQYFFFFPLFLILFFSFFRKPNILRAFFLGLCLTLCFLTTVYYSIFLAILLVSTLLIIYFLKPQEITLTKLKHLSIGFIIGLLPLTFFILPYLKVLNSFGKRNLYEAFYMSANSLSIFSSTNYNWLYNFSASYSDAEKRFFPGFFLLILIIIALYRLVNTKKLFKLASFFVIFFFLSIFFGFPNIQNFFALAYLLEIAFVWASLVSFFLIILKLGKLERKLNFNIFTDRNFLGLFLGLALLFLYLSFGPIGNPNEGEFPGGIYSVFYYLFPGTQGIRAVSRFAILSIFFCILCIPFIYKLLKNHKFLLTLLLLIPIGENLVTTYPLEEPKRTPDVFGALNNIKNKNSSMIILPYALDLKNNGGIKSWGDFAKLNVNYMNWSSPYKVKILNGYSGQRTDLMNEYPRKLENFPDVKSIKALEFIPNLEKILVISKEFKNFDKKEFEKKVESFFPKLEILQKDGEDNYLINFNLETLIQDRESFYLKVPNLPEKVLNLELKASSEIKLDVFIDKYFEDTPLTSFTIKSDGKYNMYHLTIPELTNTVTPFIYRFKVNGDALVTLRKRFL